MYERHCGNSLAVEFVPALQSAKNPALNLKMVILESNAGERTGERGERAGPTPEFTFDLPFLHRLVKGNDSSEHRVIREGYIQSVCEPAVAVYLVGCQ